MVIYGGDEVSALVLDIGGTWTRAGYAGEDIPKVVVPSWVGTTDVGDDTISKSIRSTGDMSVANPDVEMGDATAEAKPTEESAAAQKYYIGDTETSTWRPNMGLKSPLEDGLVTDWDIYENLWNYCFQKRLRVSPSENPLFVTETAWNTPALREKLVELAFEKFDVPAFYVSKDPVLTSFAAGRSTSLVLDCGGTTTSATAVFDGYALKKVYQNVAGDFISDQILAQLKRDHQKEVVPRYQVAQKRAVEAGQPADVDLRVLDGPTDPSYHHRMQLQAVHEYKELVCQVSETTFNADALRARPPRAYEFPDGYNLQVGIARFEVPEILFQPERFIIDRTQTVRLNGSTVPLGAAAPGESPAGVGATPTAATNGPAGGGDLLGVPRMIYNCINACDVDMRPHLFSNVILTGGSTLFPGFADRVNFELQHLAPGSRIRIHAPGSTVERKFSTWLGGSILSSLGTFHQLWISKQEYQESGASIVNKKCQ
ncbi:NuA4 histone acetyltransferase subunit [Tieghemiomyces parasiticus]|uniref:NuA4 histone acetyltransferase subunit n=1 Tax=Tieghemiomyces parasiticus TaxID=78921 RepID=A0A9W8AJD6_9FUNG|nr:NuA4 histone acetyltransferase subunit [Tieghemiomyces parasiticus]